MYNSSILRSRDKFVKRNIKRVKDIFLNNDTDAERTLLKRARQQLKYSISTLDSDILRSLFSAYKRTQKRK